MMMNNTETKCFQAAEFLLISYCSLQSQDSPLIAEKFVVHKRDHKST
jgi:hypothetical protein